MPVRRILYHDLPVHAATKGLNARVWIKGVSKNVDRQIMDLMKKTSGGWDPAVEASGSAYCSLRKTPKSMRCQSRPLINFLYRPRFNPPYFVKVWIIVPGKIAFQKKHALYF
jgi:hypothetical protein